MNRGCWRWIVLTVITLIPASLTGLGLTHTILDVALQPGTKLGAYEILAAGMDEG